MVEKAHAKINLSLNIRCRREDGYHELESVFLPLELHDTLEVQLAQENRIICDDASIPVDHTNLIWKAMELMQTKCSRRERFCVTLTKRIPAQAGLGGGSSDAAAMLRAINQMLDLQLMHQEMVEFAKELGADVPFFLKQQPALVSGIGERMTEIVFPFDLPVLLVKPSQGVSTKVAYDTLRLDRCDHPNIERLVATIQNNDYDSMISMIGNDLEESALRLVPAIKEFKAVLQEMGFDAVLMSGSGSTVFALSRDENLLERGRQYFLRQNELTEVADKTTVIKTKINCPVAVHFAKKI